MFRICDKERIYYLDVSSSEKIRDTLPFSHLALEGEFTPVEEEREVAELLLVLLFVLGVFVFVLVLGGLVVVLVALTIVGVAVVAL